MPPFSLDIFYLPSKLHQCCLEKLEATWGHGLLTGYQGPHHWFTICSQIAGSGRSGTGARLRGRMAVAGDHLRWLVQGSSLSRSSKLHQCCLEKLEATWGHGLLTGYQGPHHWFTICSQIAGSGRSGTGARLRGRMAVAGDHLR